MVKYRQPGTHAIRQSADVFRIDFMAVQLADNVLSHGVVIYQAYKGRLQLHIRDILRHISGHSAVVLHDNSGIPPGGMYGDVEYPLQIHKYSADHYNSHLCFSLSLYSYSEISKISCEFLTDKTLTNLL